MSKRAERLRKAYEFKLGKKIVSDLSDEQIENLSKFYNSLSETEQRKIDSDIFKGKTNPLDDMAKGFIEESKTKPAKKPKASTKKTKVTEKEELPEGLDDLIKDIVNEEVKENIPEGLDDLLNEVKKKEPTKAPTKKPRTKKKTPQSSSSIVKSSPPKVTGDIDSRVSSLLGTDVFDLTEDEYFTLLKEKRIEAEKYGSSYSTEDIELLTNELKRVKDKRSDKIPPRKRVDLNKVLKTKKISPAKISSKKLLPLSALKKPEEDDDKVSAEKENKNILDSILKEIISLRENVKQIISLFKEQNNLIRSSRESERITASKEKKKTREEKLEKKDSGKSDKVLDKVAAPFENFFDKIMNFFKFILLGGFLEGLLKVIKDPQILLKPIQDIVNNIIGFFNGIIQWIDDNIVGAFRTLIDYINSGLKNITNTLNNIIKAIPNWMPFKPDLVNDPPVIPQIPNLPQIPQATFAEPNIQTQNTGGKVVNVNQGDNITNTVINAKDLKFKSGGKIDTDSGITISGLGPDTQLIAAQPGEIVINKAAVDGFGAENLLNINAVFGNSNANKPKSVKSGIVKAMTGGGFVQPVPKGSYKGSRGQRYGDPRSYGPHAGIDITEDAPWGSDPKIPVVSMKDGKVVRSSPGYSYKTSGYTSNLTVDHGGGILATYLHMKPSLKPGDDVKKGQVVGRMIDLGDQTHLHLQMYQNGRQINPLNFIKNAGKVDNIIPSPSSGDESTLVASTATSEGSTNISGTSQPAIPQYDTSNPYAGGLYTIGGGAGGAASAQQQSSSAGANQSPVPTFSADDPMNPSLLVVKSIYNIVG